MSIQKQIWVNYIVENLYKQGNEFLEFAVNDDQYVNAGILVHKPQANQKPGSQKNRKNLPAQVKRLSASDSTYLLDEFTTDPELISNADLIELSYDKLSSALYNHMMSLRQLTAEDTLYKWVASDTARGFQAATVIRTTGASTPTHLAGTTGNRKGFMEDDLQTAKFLLDEQEIAKEDRVALIPTAAMKQLYTDLKTKYDLSFAKDVLQGRIDSLHGFKIIQRSTTVRYTNAATPVAKAIEAANAATDNDSVICWQKGSVARARGTVQVFEELDSPTYYGDVYSALLRFGGQKQRSDAKGIVSIVQDAV